eukprot:TRINITY_DN13569_c0_g1_i3.p1 TRINITY_DN13569_c0_g1~~TRINITY_DN13569_c0_g1_i3.p1  ORF type:complete len:106 (-),score=25.68 TRINITY_DN13569_c0_g1_i3:378-695(-)
MLRSLVGSEMCIRDRNMDRLMHRLTQLWEEGDCSMEIPDQVLTAVDQGSNPDEYTRDRLVECHELELQLNGKVGRLAAFHAALKQLAPETVTEQEWQAYKRHKHQ